MQQASSSREKTEMLATVDSLCTVRPSERCTPCSECLLHMVLLSSMVESIGGRKGREPDSVASNFCLAGFGRQREVALKLDKLL